MIYSWRDTRLEETSYAVKPSAFANTLQQVHSPKETTILSLCHKPQSNSNLHVLKRDTHTHTHKKQTPKPKSKALRKSNNTSQGNSRRYLEPEHHPLLGAAWARECGT